MFKNLVTAGIKHLENEVVWHFEIKEKSTTIQIKRKLSNPNQLAREEAEKKTKDKKF